MCRKCRDYEKLLEGQCPGFAEALEDYQEFKSKKHTTKARV